MVKEIPFKDGPFLTSAVICDKVLEEKSGVKSAIRMIDRLVRTVVSAKPPKDMEPFDYDLTILIKFISGKARGPFTIELRLVKPSGESPTPYQHTVHFEGEEDRGVDLVVGMRITFDMTGVYWFYLTVEDVRITQIPLRVIYTPQVKRD